MKRATQWWMVVLFAAGCGGGVSTGDWTIETTLDRNEAAAGDTVTVTCVFRKGGIEAGGTPTIVTVTPAEAATVTDHQVVPTRAGDQAVACALADGKTKDDTPAPLKVRAGAPKKVTAVLDKDSTLAGIPVGVECRVEDAWGNPVADAATIVDPKPDLEVVQKSVASKKIGPYEITCSVDGSPDAEKVPATLTVKPGEPASVRVTADPNFKFYGIDDQVTVGYEALDAFDNVIPDVPGHITGPGKPGVKDLGGGKWKFIDQGQYPFTATLEAPWENITATRVLACDVASPNIEVLFPPRGYTKDGDDPSLVVKGVVTDGAGSGIASVKINGQDADLKADGSFSLPVQSTHGLNGLVISATDEYGFNSYVTRGYYYSRGWFPVGANPKIEDLTMNDAAMVFLGQTALDDGVHDPSRLNDIATLLEVLLGPVLGQLTAQLPPFDFPLPNAINLTIAGVGLQGDLDFGIVVKQLSLGQPHVKILCREGGVAVTLEFEQVSLALDLTVTVHARATGFGQTVPLLDPSTTVGTALNIQKVGITLDVDIDKAADGPLHAEGKNFDLTLDGFAFDPVTNLVITLGKVPGTNIDLGSLDLTSIVGPISDFLGKNLLNPFVKFIKDPIIALLEPLVTNLIGTALEQLVGLFAIHQTIEIPPILGGQPLPLEFQTGLSTVHFTPDGGTLGVNLGLLTAKQVEHDPIGAIRRASCNTNDPEGQYTFQPKPGIQAALKYDLVNQLLFTLWRGGLLNGPFDLSGMLGGGLPISNLVVTPDFYLPPILDDCQNRTQEIQIGDAYLQLDFEAFGYQSVGVWLQARAQAEIFAQGNELGIRIGEVTFFETEIYDLTGGLGDLLDLVTSFIPSLLDMVQNQELKFPIPAIPLDGILPGLPAGAQLELGNLKSSTDGGVIMIGADLLPLETTP